MQFVLYIKLKTGVGSCNYLHNKGGVKMSKTFVTILIMKNIKGEKI